MEGFIPLVCQSGVCPECATPHIPALRDSSPRMFRLDFLQTPSRGNAPPTASRRCINKNGSGPFALSAPLRGYVHDVRFHMLSCQPEIRPLSSQIGQCQFILKSFSSSIKAIICPRQGFRPGRLRHLISVSGVPVRVRRVTASTMEPK